jgi:hypothetical protein
MPSWTPIDDVWDYVEETFDGAFETVRRSSLHQSYSVIVAKATDALPLHPRLEPSESSRNSAMEQRVSIFGTRLHEGAHMIPHSPICAASYGIISQAALGVNFESKNLDRETLILTLQQVVCGRSDGQTKSSSGLRYSPYNLVSLPNGHKDYFDNNPALVVVPILELERGVKDWVAGREYWVMCIAGHCAENDATDEEWYTDIFRGQGYDSSTRMRCSERDIRMATLLLGQFVKAHASVLNREYPAINPLDLFHGNGREVLDRKAMLRDTRTQLQANNTVKVPSVKRTTGDRSRFTWHVMKVKLTGSIPDPLLVANKAAVNWSSRCGQKLLPACPDGPDVDAEHEYLYALGREEAEASLANYDQAVTPVGRMIGVPSSSRRVTLSPDKEATHDRAEGKADGLEWENLEEDDE